MYYVVDFTSCVQAIVITNGRLHLISGLFSQTKSVYADIWQPWENEEYPQYISRHYVKKGLHFSQCLPRKHPPLSVRETVWARRLYQQGVKGQNRFWRTVWHAGLRRNSGIASEWKTLRVNIGMGTSKSDAPVDGKYFVRVEERGFSSKIL